MDSTCIVITIVGGGAVFHWVENNETFARRPKGGSWGQPEEEEEEDAINNESERR